MAGRTHVVLVRLSVACPVEARTCPQPTAWTANRTHRTDICVRWWLVTKDHTCVHVGLRPRGGRPTGAAMIGPGGPRLGWSSALCLRPARKRGFARQRVRARGRLRTISRKPGKPGGGPTSGAAYEPAAVVVSAGLRPSPLRTEGKKLEADQQAEEEEGRPGRRRGC